MPQTHSFIRGATMVIALVLASGLAACSNADQDNSDTGSSADGAASTANQDDDGTSTGSQDTTVQTNGTSNDTVPVCKAPSDAAQATAFLCVDGIYCPSCAQWIADKIADDVPCVIDATLLEDPVGVEVLYYPDYASVDDVVSIIEDDLGYSVSCIEQH